MNKKFKWKNIIFILILFYAGYVFINQQIAIHKIKNEIAQKKLEEQKVKNKNKKLQDEVKMSESDVYIEKLARERLGLIKQGEIPVIDQNSNK